MSLCHNGHMWDFQTPHVSVVASFQNGYVFISSSLLTGITTGWWIVQIVQSWWRSVLSDGFLALHVVDSTGLTSSLLWIGRMQVTCYTFYAVFFYKLVLSFDQGIFLHWHLSITDRVSHIWKTTSSTNDWGLLVSAWSASHLLYNDHRHIRSKSCLQVVDWLFITLLWAKMIGWCEISIRNEDVELQEK